MNSKGGAAHARPGLWARDDLHRPRRARTMRKEGAMFQHRSSRRKGLNRPASAVSMAVIHAASTGVGESSLIKKEQDHVH